MEVFDVDGDTTFCFLEVPTLKQLELFEIKSKVETVEIVERFSLSF
jgi:hypothetical protein